MPVTVQCASTKPEKFQNRSPVDDLSRLFTSSKAKNAEEDERKAEMMRSWEEEEARKEGKPLPNVPKVPPYRERCVRVELGGSRSAQKSQISSCANGLVHALEAAYSHHHHLVLRPDDVWLAILTQFSIYVNAHGEELRSHFVTHEGQKELEVKGIGNIDNADFGAMASEMGRLLQENVIDPDLRKWIIPDFSTTAQNDIVVASIVMMATLQTYFKYLFSLMCGIPSVTLLGTEEDWSALRARVDKLDSFGEEPKQWAALLRPVCDSFVACFDTKSAASRERSSDFWSRVCHHESGGSGPTYLCGWVTVFCVWSDEGKWQGDVSKTHNTVRGKDNLMMWPIIDTDNVPRACAEVPVKVDDNGTMCDTVMVAGLPAFQVDSNAAGEEALSPVSGWAMYEVPSV